VARVLLFLLILACAAALASDLIASQDKSKHQLGVELGKLVGQVLLVGVVGGIVLHEYNHRRERQAALNEFRRTPLRNLVDAYARTKKSRRLLRSGCRARGPLRSGQRQLVLRRVVYDEQLGSLNDTQLQLEIIVHELSMYGETFRKRAEIRSHVDKMENYLGTVITEYESALRDH
jgi:hypothetical protein